jgi:carbonic anhydrase
MIVVRSRFVAGLLATGAIAASSSLLAADPKPDAAVLEATEQAALKGVLTREEQAALTPQVVLDTLLAGNERFVRNDLTQRNHSQRIREAYAGQFPKAVVLSCLDSRIPVEDVFDRGIGDIFVARVAGNFVNEDILGSMEFACHVAGAKLIMVIGHTNCGAVKAAIDDVKLGNITPMLAKIRPATIPRTSPMSAARMCGWQWRPSGNAARSCARWRRRGRSRSSEPTTTSVRVRSLRCRSRTRARRGGTR